MSNEIKSNIQKIIDTMISDLQSEFRAGLSELKRPPRLIISEEDLLEGLILKKIEYGMFVRTSRPESADVLYLSRDGQIMEARFERSRTDRLLKLVRSQEVQESGYVNWSQTVAEKITELKKIQEQERASGRWLM